jgi:menaquinone-dependent protoporphyrinogen oxidase
MLDTILISYATKHGSTQEVAEAIAAALREAGRQVDVRPAADVRDMAGYGAVILGAPLYMARWHKDARRFLKRHRDALAALPIAIFALGPLQTREEKPGDYDTARRQLERALAKLPGIEPTAVEVFGGACAPAELGFPFNRMPAADVRDWEAISLWAREVDRLLVAVDEDEPVTIAS